ncbi:UDP-glucose/GDP-mannose dehydrogenase family protein [Phototrophicus methaneseepsis]|uniref:UDP-glucose 6-dehydrogenase n=1 Tax=Phototrophicus methaneseepsis TaxID=2710758 RepID=A0A7S8ECV6_9CHLR|nr:UDP-glucose/GDP-mannose dehydrogenase family protein [Phototrophicus methaneseepsis]QPC84514.1 UDP-glucose/GDP-mannose dehydrogenase family protein [Phototrophicus methaneseepsis]
MKNICVIGSGYVGLVTGTCFSDLGNKVVTVDIDESKIAKLNQGVMPIYEPGLEELVERNVKAGRLSFTTSYEEGLKDAEFVFICVGTPSAVDGEADLKYVRSAAETIAQQMDHPLVIINKSTVPVGTGDWVADIVSRMQPEPIDFAVVSCPEFLREGSAITDFMNPDRNVFGSTDQEAAEKVAGLYSALGAPAVITDIRTAEMIKYASNAFLATRISFINEISIICERLGADVTEVARGMGLDKRIGPHFLQAGVGYGGSCFPKDVKALANMALTHGMHPQLLNAVMDINDFQRKQIATKVRELLGGSLDNKTIGVLGIAFKANTDDIREAPALTVIRNLANQGANVKAYDPVAMENAEREIRNVTLVDDAYAVAEGADALILLTDWNEFKNLDMKRVKESMNEPLLVDGRNLYNPDDMRKFGFVYRGVGRGYNGEGVPNGHSDEAMAPVAGD